jgi:hypothetical protein
MEATMSQSVPEQHPELEIELLEFDETVPPRPEEDVADAGRSVPDPH